VRWADVQRPERVSENNNSVNSDAVAAEQIPGATAFSFSGPPDDCAHNQGSKQS